MSHPHQVEAVLQLFQEFLPVEASPLSSTLRGEAVLLGKFTLTLTDIHEHSDHFEQSFTYKTCIRCH